MLNFLQPKLRTVEVAAKSKKFGACCNAALSQKKSVQNWYDDSSIRGVAIPSKKFSKSQACQTLGLWQGVKAR